MLAYHNDPKIKEAIMAQLQAHYDADEFIKGKYWEGGKGCAIGCTLHSSDHEEYEHRFGIPFVLAILKDRIFEGLPNHLAKEWPLQFMDAIQVGADLSKVWAKFAIWLLTDEAHGVVQYAKNKTAAKNVADLYQRSLVGADLSKVWAKFAIWLLTDEAYGVVQYARNNIAAKNAADLYQRSLIENVAQEELKNVADAAYDYIDAAYAVDFADAYTDSAYADYAADAADAADADAYAAKQHHYIAQSQKLLQLLKNN